MCLLHFQCGLLSVDASIPVQHSVLNETNVRPVKIVKSEDDLS